MYGGRREADVEPGMRSCVSALDNQDSLSGTELVHTGKETSGRIGVFSGSIWQYAISLVGCPRKEDEMASWGRRCRVASMGANLSIARRLIAM